jgi:hypothetical protein
LVRRPLRGPQRKGRRCSAEHPIGVAAVWGGCATVTDWLQDSTLQTWWLAGSRHTSSERYVTSYSIGSDPSRQTRRPYARILLCSSEDFPVAVPLWLCCDTQVCVAGTAGRRCRRLAHGALVHPAQPPPLAELAGALANVGLFGLNRRARSHVQTESQSCVRECPRGLKAHWLTGTDA